MTKNLFDAVYYEENILNYPLGIELMEKFKDLPKYKIENHNNIEEMRKKENKEFPRMKRNLIIGVRRTQKFVPNYKVSNYLVTYTSSGCTAMCMYCYLVCHFNKCAYLRLFVNREEMLNKIIKTAEKADEDLVFEIGSNSDLILENTITGNLKWTIENFANSKKGYLTFPTKFHMVEDILDVNGKDRIIVRMSLNPTYIISRVELGTSNLKQRLEAIIKLAQAGYKVGILIAPIILLDNYKELYEELFITIKQTIPEKLLKDIFFELIFMTYSFVHNAINTDAFPNAIKIYDKAKFTSRGMGKYSYKKDIRDEATVFFKELLNKYFPDNKLWYIS
ncbi:MAG: spore photoproduct lyase [Clostridia bacterium]|nr:spore photoproduct lyase [Clostridia bacterium]